MSVEMYRWTEDCVGRECPMDCDLCTFEPKPRWRKVYDSNAPLFFQRAWVCPHCGVSNTYGEPPYCMYCGHRVYKENEDDHQ